MADVSETGEAQVEARRIAESWAHHFTNERDKCRILARAYLALLSERVEAEAPDQRAEQAAREERLREALIILGQIERHASRTDDLQMSWVLMMCSDASDALEAALPTPDPSQDVDAE